MIGWLCSMLVACAAHCMTVMKMLQDADLYSMMLVSCISCCYAGSSTTQMARMARMGTWHLALPFSRMVQVNQSVPSLPETVHAVSLLHVMPL